MFMKKISSQSLRSVLMTVATILLSAGAMWAQNIKVTGTVTDKNGEPLIGVYVLIEGTQTGTSTEADGTYSLSAPANSVLLFSSMGYQEIKEAVNNRSVINVVMQDDAVLLDDVVVTAMGIKKERKALGYAVQDIKGEELMRNKNNNLINSLNGKIAGLNITNTGGTPGASSSIIIRGGTSLERDNQPLFVVDGIPIDNSTNDGNSAFDGSQGASIQNGNRAMDINPEDIESMSVLKGPAAAALYGIRAAAGAIIITTKKGKEGGVTVGFNARYSHNWVNKLPEQQNIYNQGTYYTGSFNDATFTSWGDKIGTAQTYDNLKDFFKPAGAYELNMNVSGGSEKGNFYLSVSRLDQDGVVRTTDYVRNSVRFNGEQKVGKHFTFGANVAFTSSESKKTLTGTGLWGSGGNGALQTAYSWPQTNNMSEYLNPDGSMKLVVPGVELKDNALNPYWQLYKNPVSDQTDRLLGNVYTNIKVTDWFSINYKFGLDIYKSKYSTFIAPGSPVDEELQNGMISKRNEDYHFYQSNLMLNFQKSFLNNKLDVSLLLGESVDMYEWNTMGVKAINFVIKDFESPNNADKINKTYIYDDTKKRLIGLYGDFRISWDKMIYIGITGRNDWSSTLPKANRSFFYPSFSGSFVFTELIPKNKVLSFGKVRASYASVGKDAPAYQTKTYLFGPEATIGGGYRNSWTGGNPYLKPEKTNSMEFGLEARFLDGKIGFDFAWYKNKSEDQILQPRVSNGTGYILRYVNTGTIENKGIELTIDATPVETKKFRWNTSLNISHNKGIVYNLPAGMDLLYVTSVQMGNAKPASFNDGYFMAITGQRWKYDTDKSSQFYGKTILDWETGLPTVTSAMTEYVGLREPKLLGGFNNTFSFYGVDLNILLDFRIGGDIYNGTLYDMTTNGMSKLTENRNEKISLSGIALNPATNQYEEVTREVVASEKFYTDYYLKHTPNFVEKDINWLRLRSVSATYNLPRKWMEKTGFIKSASISVAGTNLALWTNYTGMDPEVAAGGAGAIGSGSAGFDYCGVPNTAGVSFSINLKF